MGSLFGISNLCRSEIPRTHRALYKRRMSCNGGHLLPSTRVWVVYRPRDNTTASFSTYSLGLSTWWWSLGLTPATRRGSKRTGHPETGETERSVPVLSGLNEWFRLLSGGSEGLSWSRLDATTDLYLPSAVVVATGVVEGVTVVSTWPKVTVLVVSIRRVVPESVSSVLRDGVIDVFPPLLTEEPLNPQWGKTIFSPLVSFTYPCFVGSISLSLS